MSRNIVDIADIAGFEQETAAFNDADGAGGAEHAKDAAGSGPEPGGDTGGGTDLDLEAPEADVAEQRAEAVPDAEEEAAQAGKTPPRTTWRSTRRTPPNNADRSRSTTTTIVDISLTQR